MTKQELTDWALAHGWRMIDGMLCLTKPSAPKEAIVRLVLKATVVAVEVKRPAGKWEKLASQSYAKVSADPESGQPLGLQFEAIPGFAMLMRENQDQMVFAGAAWGKTS